MLAPLYPNLVNHIIQLQPKRSAPFLFFISLSLLSLSPFLYLSSLSIHQSLSLSRSPSSSTLLEGFPSRVCCACLTPTWRKVASTSSPPLSSSGTVSPLNQQRGSDRYLDELTRKHRVYVNKCSGRSMEVKLFDHLGMYDRQSKRLTERQNDTSNNLKKKKYRTSIKYTASAITTLPRIRGFAV